MKARFYWWPARIRWGLAGPCAVSGLGDFVSCPRNMSPFGNLVPGQNTIGLIARKIRSDRQCGNRPLLTWGRVLKLISDRRMSIARERRTHPAFINAYRRLETEAKTFLGEEMQPQDRPAGYYHNYFCPDHAVELVFDAGSPHAHRCPRDGRGLFGRAIRFGMALVRQQSACPLGI